MPQQRASDARAVGHDASCRLERVYRLTARLAQARTAEEVLDAAVDSARQGRGVSAAFTCLLEGGRCVLCRGDHADEPEAIAAAVRAGRAALLPGGAAALAVAPLASGGRVFGALGARLGEDGDAGAELEFLTAAGRQCGQALAAMRPDEAAGSRAAAELESLLSHAPIGFAFFDREHRYVRVNEQLCRMNGLPREAHLGRRVAELVPANAPSVDPILDEVFNGGVSVEREIEGETPAEPGVRRNWLTGFYPVFGEGGEVSLVGAFVVEISGRKRMKEALRQSEERFRDLADNISQFAWMADATGWIFWYNRRWYEYTGTTLDEMRGWGWKKVHHPDHVGRVEARFRHSIETGEPWEDTFPLRGRDGSYRWFLSRALPIRDQTGRVVRWFGTNTDITEHLEAEDRLRESEQRYRALFESMQESFALGEILCDGAGKPVDWIYLDVNPAFEAVHGVRREDVVGRTFREVFPGARHDYWIRACAEAALGGKPARLAQFDSGRYWEGTVYSPRRGQFALIFNDVTERRKAEQALLESEERFRTLFTSMSEGFALGEVIESDGGPPADFRFIEMNDAFYGQSGLGREIVGRPIREVLPELEPVWVETYCRVALTGEPVKFNEYNRDTGRHYSVFAYSPSHGRFAILFRDITDIKRAEEMLRDSERQFRELADSMPQLVWVADASGGMTYFNRRWYEQTGLGEEESRAGGWVGTMHPEERERVVALWRRCVETGESFQTEYRLRVAGGEYRWFLTRAVPVRDEQGRIARWFGTDTDIDDSKRAGERLRHTQKLESVGLLAGGIAHDFNNLLTGILGNASLVLDEVAPGPAERIRQVIASAERAASLTRQLLAYSGKGQFVLRDLDVSQAVNEMADLVQFSIPKSADLAISLQKRLPVVRMDPGQLQQILMNLVINAGEAIGEGNPGRITVSTASAEVEKPFLDDIGGEVAAGRYVAIEVGDTGGGVPAEAKSKIFDPFFTTKFTGRGLGLAAVAGIVRSQKGGITVESVPDRGSTFRVYLPAAGERARQPEPRESAEARATVLVVDDEASVRDFIAAVLRRKGLRVLTAADGREALAVWERESGRIDLAIVDVVMPVMAANELLPTLKQRDSRTRILLTSGYSEAEARRLCAVFPGAAFVQKPYTAQQIGSTVERLLSKG